MRPTRDITTRIIRPGDSQPSEADGRDVSMEERVWELTRQSLAWNGDPPNEPRLDRSVTRIHRSWR